MKIITNNENLNDIISNNVTIIDCYAEWCGPCKLFSPIFESVELKHKKVNFCKLNVDKCEEISRELNIMSIPTIILFKDGKELKRNIGFMNEDELINFIGDIYV